MRTLKELNKEYEDIIHSELSDQKKGIQLAELMTEMERDYKVPALRNIDWENKNRSVIALYRKISMSRNFD